MPEELREARPFYSQYRCDTCGEGYLQGVLKIAETPTPVWRHVCIHCRVEKNIIGKCFPRITYQFVATVPIDD